MDLDEMLHVDRCRDMDELIDWLTFEADPDYSPDYSPDARTGLLSPISYKRCRYAEFYVGKISRIRIGAYAATRVVLKWFDSLSRKNTFVCCIVSEIKRDSGWKSRVLYPFLHNNPLRKLVENIFALFFLSQTNQIPGHHVM